MKIAIIFLFLVFPIYFASSEPFFGIASQILGGVSTAFRDMGYAFGMGGGAKPPANGSPPSSSQGSSSQETPKQDTASKSTPTTATEPTTVGKGR